MIFWWGKVHHVLHLKWIIINLKYKWCFIFYIWRPSCVDAIIPLLYGTKSIINDPRSFLVQLNSDGIFIMHQKCNYLDCLLWTNTLWFYGWYLVQITWQMIIDTIGLKYFWIQIQIQRRYIGGYFIRKFHILATYKNIRNSYPSIWI